jgi:SIR2-like domain
VEQAFDLIRKPYDLVIHPADRKDIANSILWWPHGESEPKVEAPNTLDLDLRRTTVIYKMHGTVLKHTDKWDNFVITEDDYVDFLSRMTTQTAVPSIFYEYFHSRSFLFLGYSLRDWNLRVVLRNLSQPLGSRVGTPDSRQDEPLPSWAIQYQPSELEQTLWRARGVHIFDVELDEFVARIQPQHRQ